MEGRSVVVDLFPITVASIIFAIFGILELVATVVMIVLIGLVAGSSEGTASQVIS